MSSDQVSNDESLRMVGADWLFHKLWNSSSRAHPPLYYEYFKTIMNLTAAGGVLTDTERKWILGNLAAFGGPAEAYERLKTYTPNKDDLEKTINEKLSFTKAAARALLFEAFQAASSDGELNQAQREAIYRMGQTMELPEVVIQQLEKAAYDDIVNRQRIISVVWPEGLAKAADDSMPDF